MQNVDHFQNADSNELNHFSQLAQSWWDIDGAMKMLHAVNPIRMAFILDCLDIRGKNMLDIGCGGGILTERLCHHQASVLGIDLSSEAIAVAKQHAEQKQDWISRPHYQVISAEALAKQQSQTYDAITCMECLEHVPDPLAIIRASAAMLKPGGFLFLSTINRTVKAYLHAIIGAEYLLNLIPKHTHHYDKFIRVQELDGWARQYHLKLHQLSGIEYHPIAKHFTLTQDVSVNYLACFQLADN